MRTYAIILGLLLLCGCSTEESLDIPDTTDVMRILLPDSALNALDEKRSLAMEDGVLINTKLDWQWGQLVYKGDTCNITARLKGTGPSDLDQDHFPLRVNIKDDFYTSWRGYKKVSLVPVDARSYHDWFYNMVLTMEDVLAKRIELIPLQINDKDPELYYIEGHFTKRLLESQGRREGVIIRLNEDEYLQHLLQTNMTPDCTIPFYGAAAADNYSGKKVLRDSIIGAQYQIAQNLLFMYVHGQSSASEVFDVDLLAKYLAVIELSDARRGFNWMSQRWYYNPITSKLEPIAAIEHEQHGDIVSCEPSILDHGVDAFTGHPYTAALYQDSLVSERLRHYLIKFSSDEYLEQFSNYVKNWTGGIELIQQYDPDVSLDVFDLKMNDKSVNQLVEQGWYHPTELELAYPVATSAEISSITVKSYLQGIDSVAGTSEVMVVNHSSAAAMIHGYTRPDGELVLFDAPFEIGPWEAEFPHSETIGIESLVAGVLVSEHTNESLVSIPLINHSGPTLLNPRQQIIDNALDISTIDWIVEGKDGITITSGSHVLDKDLVIPEGTRLTVEPQTTIDLQNGSAILSWSPVTMVSDAIHDIIIKSSDRTGQGMAVFSQEGSELAFVRFENLGSLNRDGWWLTGAVTFYDANSSSNKVTMNAVEFINSRSEDALNLVRCMFELSWVKIDSAASDGFDADFCAGEIKNSDFKNTQNDCLDFSSSTIDVFDCTINGAGDKGISVGERSTVTIQYGFLDGAYIGVATKDRSTTVIDGLELMNCSIGFALFQKKPEFGSCDVILKDYTAGDGIEQLFLIEKGSSVTMPDAEIVEGRENVDIIELYGL